MKKNKKKEIQCRYCGKKYLATPQKLYYRGPVCHRCLNTINKGAVNGIQ